MTTEALPTPWTLLGQQLDDLQRRLNDALQAGDIAQEITYLALTCITYQTDSNEPLAEHSVVWKEPDAEINFITTETVSLDEGIDTRPSPAAEILSEATQKLREELAAISTEYVLVPSIHLSIQVFDNPADTAFGLPRPHAPRGGCWRTITMADGGRYYCYSENCRDTWQRCRPIG